MKEILALISILVVTSAAVFSQTSDSASSVGVKTPAQSGYSESKSYQPTEFKDRKVKSKKEKKSKNDSPKIEGADKLAESPLIAVPLSVFDRNGKFVPGLQKSDFTVFVDGRERGINEFENGDQPLNLIFLIDTSPSAAYRIEEIQDYVSSIVERLRPADKVMIAEFNEKIKVLTELTGDRQKIDKAVRQTKFGNGTSLYDAVQILFRNYIDAIEGRKALILLTDGVDTTSTKSSYEKSLIEAEKSGTPVFPIYFDTLEQNAKAIAKKPPFIDVGSVIPGLVSGLNKADYELGRRYLNDLVSLSGGRAITVQNAAGAQKTLSSFIAEEMRLKYYLKINPSETAETAGRKQIKVRIDRPDLYILARGSYFAVEKK